MDPWLTQEQRDLYETITRFAHRELNDDLQSRDEQGAFSWHGWKKCAELGLPGLAVPAEYGGAGADAVTTMAALEALGYGCRDNGLIFSLNAHLWAGAMPIVKFGTERLKRRYLPGLCDGSLIASHALSEPEAGSDALALTARATLTADGGYELTGTKTFVTNAPVADVFIVFASTDPARRFAGVSAYVVDRDTPGLSVGKQVGKLGLRTSPMSEIHMEHCRVPASQLLGPPGAGLAVFNAAMRLERAFILAAGVGALRRDLERCVEHARLRRQYGRPIGDFQAVAHRIVGMRLRLETSRLLLYHVGRLLDAGHDAALEITLAKLHISETLVTSALDAVQVHGGAGYLTGDAERGLRDAVGSRIYSGTSEVQQNIAARLLGLGLPERQDRKDVIA